MSNNNYLQNNTKKKSSGKISKRDVLKHLIIGYQQKKVGRRQIISMITGLVMSIPAGFRDYDNDIKQEFFAYFLTEFDEILSRYKVQENASAHTWLFLVLKRRYLYFKHLRSRNIDYDELPFDETALPLENDNEEKRPHIKKVDLSFLTSQEQKIISTKYGISVAGYRNESADEIIKKKMQRKKSIEEKLQVKFHKLLRLREELANTTEFGLKKRLLEKEKKLFVTKRKLESIYLTLAPYPSNKWVGLQFGISEGTVSSHLSRIRKKIMDRGMELSFIIQTNPLGETG